MSVNQLVNKVDRIKFEKYLKSKSMFNKIYL